MSTLQSWAQTVTIAAVLVAALIYQTHNLDKRIDDLRAELKQRFDDFRAELKHRFDDFRAELNHRFDDSEAKANQRFGDFQAEANHRFGDFQLEVNYRFGDFQAGMNARFEAIDRRFDDLKDWIRAEIRRLEARIEHPEQPAIKQ